MTRRIAIIGAGISGLLACKYTMQMGFNPVVFEAKSSIGGVWSKTIDSTRLQTPKDFYQFSDFAWPSSVAENFPDHSQVMDYISSYADHFNVLSCIRCNSKVTCIDYITSSDEETIDHWELWGGTGEAFSPKGKWNVTVKDLMHPLEAPQVYEADFVILCVGKFSGLPNIPHFPVNKGPEVFEGVVLHSMDYAAMDNNQAVNYIKDKRVAIVGFQKSALDVAAEVAEVNGVNYPSTLVFKTVHWTVPENLINLLFRNLNRFSEFMIHKPREGAFLGLLATLLSPLLWFFSKFIETYLKWIYPLEKYGMEPSHGFLQQIMSCMITVLPTNFYNRVADGSLNLKKVSGFSFCKSGLVLDGEVSSLQTDVVIFATGYRGEEKLSSIFTSAKYQKCITGSSAPFYRECIHPQIPQLAILGFSDSPASLYTTEMRSKWLAHFLNGKFNLPSIKEMEEDVMGWEICSKRFAWGSYKRACVSVLLQIFCNDQLCRDMNCSPWRKKNIFAEMFMPYNPLDYSSLSVN